MSRKEVVYRSSDLISMGNEPTGSRTTEAFDSVWTPLTDGWEPPTFWIRGNDAIAAFFFHPSPPPTLLLSFYSQRWRMAARLFQRHGKSFVFALRRLCLLDFCRGCCPSPLSYQREPAANDVALIRASGKSEIESRPAPSPLPLYSARGLFFSWPFSSEVTSHQFLVDWKTYSRIPLVSL